MSNSSWISACTIYAQPRVLAMIFLGFSAGLPYLLVFSTLSAWLSDAGTSHSLIGFFSWIGITYSIKAIWAPIIDRLKLPYLTTIFGRRRSWMLVAQLGIGCGLIGMAYYGNNMQLQAIAIAAIMVAFFAATQDIVIDAYRIEAAIAEYQGAMAATYVFGYRLGLLVAGAGSFYLAELTGWVQTYLIMSGLTIIGMLTTLFIQEPLIIIDQRTQKLEQQLENRFNLFSTNHINRLLKVFIDAVVSPLAEFFQRHGYNAWIILALIALYKMSDITIGVMANPFYLDLGFNKKDIAEVSKIFGFFMTIFGASIGGILVARYGIMRPLLLGSILVSLTNLLFAALAINKPTLAHLAIVVSADNLGGGIASSAFIAYLSSLTHQAYTATQYALFSSLMVLPANIMGGFSGLMVDILGYPLFFIYTAILGIPAILLIIAIHYCKVSH
ncbi:MAG: hypothetical protein RL637_1880 [Pseudomonadota bacterium]|jgi:PAT family beta-lactamase induction signal transducer AmpG